MNSLFSDIRYALRTLVTSPGFTTVALATLALGIGANTALFSVINGVLLNPLAYPKSSQLVAIYGRAPGFDKASISYLNFLDWHREARSFSSMAIYRGQDYNFTGTEQGERLSGYMISADFFSTLQVNPVLGRNFRADDDQLGAAPVAILGGGLWKRNFGSSPDVIGRPITLNGASYTIVGVIPASFSFYGNIRDVYTPIGQWNDPSFRDRRISVSARAFGRLKAGLTLAQAQAEMDAIARNLATAFPEADKELGINLVSMKEDIVGDVQPLLLVLLAAVGFLLLIACANVASLLLARSVARSRELLIRVALGASHGRLVRQLLTESVSLAALGGALGILVAFLATHAVLHWMPDALPRVEEISIDTRVLLFTLAVSLLVGVLFGLSPALKSTRLSLVEALKEGGRGTRGARHRVHGIFIAGEIAVALVLLVGAGLMVRTLAALWRVDPGFNPSHAIRFLLAMPSSHTTTSAETRARLRQFDDKMQSIPGVRAVSITLGSFPLTHNSSLPFWIQGEPKPAHDNEMHQAMFYLVEAGFQKAMGITLERGRFVTPGDDEHAPIVIDIDDAFAHTYFPSQEPIGQHVNLTQFNVQAEIVGVVGHVKQWGPGGDPKALEAQFFYPFMQLPEKLMPLVADAVAVVLRTQGDPTAMMTSVRQAVRELDPREVVYGVETLDDVWSSSMAARRLAMILLTILAALALALACVGIYGVVSYLVGQRTQEIGVRMALGAHRQDILRLVLGEGAKMAIAGAVIGALAALILTRLMANQLFGVTAHDPVTFTLVALLLITVTLAACYIPARRAMRIDPLVALRYE